jgi:hypothetical protein
MNLIVPMNPTMYAEIAGWVNYYKANPHLVGIPNTAPAMPYNGQTKLVLNDQTAEFYAAIAKQFDAPASVITDCGEIPYGSIVREYGSIAAGQILTWKVRGPSFGGSNFSGSVSSGVSVLLFGYGEQMGSFDLVGQLGSPVPVLETGWASLMLKPGFSAHDGIKCSIGS